MRMISRIVPQIALLALATCSVLGLTACHSTTGGGSEDANRLTAYLENAANYYDREHYARAYQQWDKALDIESDNVKCRLGQAMCLYQLSRAPGREGLERLIQAEAALADLLDDDLDGQEWKAQLGYGLVQERWVRLYDSRIRMAERDSRGKSPIDEKELEANRTELTRRISLAESTFIDILGSGDQAVRDRLTCLVSLARLTFMRNDLEASLAHCRAYEKQVKLSKQLWTDASARFPKERPIYEAKIDGAERQEAELRDLMGSVLFKLRRFEDAEKELDIVLTLDETRASAYLSRGIIRQNRGDWDRARADYTEFLARCGLPTDDPNVREATSRLLQVEELVDAEDELRRKIENAGK